MRQARALNNGYMQLSLLALAVVPELRISDLDPPHPTPVARSSAAGLI